MLLYSSVPTNSATTNFTFTILHDDGSEEIILEQTVESTAYTYPIDNAVDPDSRIMFTARVRGDMFFGRYNLPDKGLMRITAHNDESELSTFITFRKGVMEENQ